MATISRRTAPPVAQRLSEEPYRFDFYQAVRILELLRPGTSSVGAGADPTHEAIRFRAHLALGFPASEVVEVHDAGRGPIRVTTTFLGLAGITGPLPRPLAELLIERVARKDFAARDFLDIFNHRLISLMYRARAKHKLALGAATPQDTPVASFLFSMFGMGTAGLRGRLELRDRSLLYYTGLLSQRPRSATGLVRLLTDYFKTPFRVQQFVAAWQPLARDQWTTIGRTGTNNGLGTTAVLGTRVWDQQAGVELTAGPLTYEKFLTFLPDGASWPALRNLCRFYLGIETSVYVRLALKKEEIPPLRLDAAAPPRLGWTTWLPGARTGVDEQVRLKAVAA